MITYQQWSPMEIHILKSFYKCEELAALAAKLPNRSTEAIKRKASQLELTKREPMLTRLETIESLESKLNLKKAQMEYEAAQERYKLYAEQCRIAFTEALRRNPDITMSDLFKQNAKEFSRLNGAISNTGRKLLERQIEAGLTE